MPGWLCLVRYQTHRDKLEDREVSLYSILAKTKESDKWGAASSEDLLAVISRQGYTARHVVITGGEPCIHDLMPLTDLLEKNGFSCRLKPVVPTKYAVRRIRGDRIAEGKYAWRL
jgi:organic radical activating enzyme